MEEIFETNQQVYEAMLMDIYQLGKILNDKKYKFLRYSYQAFFTGLVLTALTAVIESIQNLQDHAEVPYSRRRGQAWTPS